MIRDIEQWAAKGAPFTWTTLGHRTLIARVVADLALVDYAEMFLELLDPFTDRIATVGQVGVIGSVAEVCARLQALLGRTDYAAALLDRAEDLATRTSSPRRCCGAGYCVPNCGRTRPNAAGRSPRSPTKRPTPACSDSPPTPARSPPDRFLATAWTAARATARSRQAGPGTLSSHPIQCDERKCT
ncbi:MULTISPECIES: hypothetical protein [Rhodococcus]|uniref:hypothetical protein n=1 Tax=Rhodococcus TaxID=1827 RepID=UPI001E294504|nr:hypothetical protein [Rhodococcus pyridinivorans]MCD2117492.1 hypothetical protein [Rhodococcus pyridinivorans]MCZ4625750.1 hypothetical protein [Rhodococcus pyridinivorans]MCZ4647572.1 hypothetical protein [Rhodococcus pyridinivorans]MDJ0480542.1 hypothetical protein [Rhodococcus pyridinivorans]MDV7253676.1 hypothetical protein [Rhodococcus pyridinivorans]